MEDSLLAPKIKTLSLFAFRASVRLGVPSILRRAAIPKVKTAIPRRIPRNIQPVMAGKRSVGCFQSSEGSSS